MVVNRNFHFDFAIDRTIYTWPFLEAIASPGPTRSDGHPLPRERENTLFPPQREVASD